MFLDLKCCEQFLNLFLGGGRIHFMGVKVLVLVGSLLHSQHMFFSFPSHRYILRHKMLGTVSDAFSLTSQISERERESEGMMTNIYHSYSYLDKTWNENSSWIHSSMAEMGTVLKVIILIKIRLRKWWWFIL